MKQFCAVVAFASSTFIPTVFAASCAPIDNVELTFYGWHDNDPPSPDNAFDCGRGNGPDGTPIAGGKQPGNFYTRAYFHTRQKYLRFF